MILSGGPDFGSGPLSERAKVFATQRRDFYQSVTMEPRGQTAMVGALLDDLVDPGCVVGVVENCLSGANTVSITDIARLRTHRAAAMLHFNTDDPHKNGISDALNNQSRKQFGRSNIACSNGAMLQRSTDLRTT